MYNASALSFLFLFVAGLVTVLLSFNLYDYYRFKYLRIYAYYILTSTILGFSYWIFKILFVSAPLSFQSQTMPIFYDISVFITIPLTITKLYLIILFAQLFLNREENLKIKILFFSVWGVLYFSLLIAFTIFRLTQEGVFIGIVFTIIYHFQFIVLLAAIGYIFLNARKKTEKSLQDNARIFASIKFFFIIIFYILTINYPSPPWAVHIFSLIYFSSILVPLLYLRYFLKNFYTGQVINIENHSKMESFFAAFSISRREQDVIRLVLQGKINKEIENELFISIHTVKAHVSNIFKKVGVSNRFHLISKVKKFKG
jgi:DNA-binding CsgD family transcriptional regulator